MRIQSFILPPVLVGTATCLSTSYTLSAFAPSNPDVHEQPINAAGQQFLIGLDKPSASCPMPPEICPPGNVTTVDGIMSNLRVTVPGGQFVYVRPDGVVAYTAPRSNRSPRGSKFAPFFLKTLISDCAPPTTLLDFPNHDEPTQGGLFACPKNATSHNTTATWLLVADTPMSLALNNTRCIALTGIKRDESALEVGAWQY